MKALIITEKCNPEFNQRDGGARIVDTLKNHLGGQCDILQFGGGNGGRARYHHTYPHSHENRFERRLSNQNYIGETIQAIAGDYTHLIFIHVSMQFGLEKYPVGEEKEIWTFPMFLTPSYEAAGETVPREYLKAEMSALNLSDGILSPSHLEKRQLITDYGISENKLFVVPRGITPSFTSTTGREIDGSLHFCSVGSIKPQKNTLELIDLFYSLQQRYPGSDLTLIGPVQNPKYASLVREKIRRLKLEERVKLTGFIEPNQLAAALSDCHIHLTTSRCETFGRSLFETLSLGMPNIALKGHHAAQDFLFDRPYIAFVDDIESAVEMTRSFIHSYKTLSTMAREVGELFSDTFLGTLLVATLLKSDVIGVCDFDGTLYHKEDKDKTDRSLATFKLFTTRILCSARPLDSLLFELERHNLQVDWIIASSGAVVSDGSGNEQLKIPLGKRDPLFHSNQERIQIELPKEEAPTIPFLRKEVYQEKAFYTHWKASKLSSLCWLLKKIKWTGRVAVFGDGEYDREMIAYFDGRRIHSTPTKIGEQKEITLV